MTEKERATKNGFMGYGTFTETKKACIAHVRRNREHFENCSCMSVDQYVGPYNVYCTPAVSRGQYKTYSMWNSRQLWSRKQIYDGFCNKKLCTYREGNNGVAIAAANLSLQCKDLKAAPYATGFLTEYNKWIPTLENDTVEGQSQCSSPLSTG